MGALNRVDEWDDRVCVRRPLNCTISGSYFDLLQVVFSSCSNLGTKAGPPALLLLEPDACLSCVWVIATSVRPQRNLTHTLIHVNDLV